MINRLNEQKMKLKEKMSRVIDEYYDEWEKNSNKEGFDINQIERMMLENHRKVKETLNESSSELASITSTDEKKMR